MTDPSALTLLIAIPRNPFDESELFPLKEILERAGVRVRVLSPGGGEALGMQKTRLPTQGRIVDWDKFAGFPGKYDAVLVLGGRGAAKSRWRDAILPQILTDHYRAGKWIAAVGWGAILPVRAGLVTGEVAGPDDADFLQELAEAGLERAESAVVRENLVITAEGPGAIEELSRNLIEVLRTP